MENEGDKSTLLGGVALSASASETVTKSFVLKENLHVQGAHVSWDGCKCGDRAVTEMLMGDDTVVGAFNADSDGTPVEGVGMFQLVGSSQFLMHQPNSITNVIPAGFKLRVTMTTTAEVGERSLGVNFIFRKPLAV